LRWQKDTLEELEDLINEVELEIQHLNNQ